jgi:hypothetical protein
MKGGHNLQLIEGGQYLDEVKAEYNAFIWCINYN